MNATEENPNLRLLMLDPFLRSRIRGQDHVIPRIVSVLLRSELGLVKQDRPRGRFMFLGPTGVGKTEITLAFTEYLFGPKKLFRFDMSEYQTQDSLGRLLGSAFGERGILGMIADQSSMGTILLDEVEKAHPRILDILLQILDAARITLASGETLDLSGFYVVLTSNIGAAELLDMHYSTFATMERHVLARAQQILRPELYARISEKLVFARLDYEIQVEIARQMLVRELKFLHERGYVLEPDATVVGFLVRQGFHPRLGARPMRDAIEKSLGDAVAASILQGESGCGRLRVLQGKLVISPEILRCAC